MEQEARSTNDSDEPEGSQQRTWALASAPTEADPAPAVGRLIQQVSYGIPAPTRADYVGSGRVNAGDPSRVSRASSNALNPSRLRLYRWRTIRYRAWQRVFAYFIMAKRVAKLKASSEDVALHMGVVKSGNLAVVAKVASMLNHNVGNWHDVENVLGGRAFEHAWWDVTTLNGCVHLGYFSGIGWIACVRTLNKNHCRSTTPLRRATGLYLIDTNPCSTIGGQRLIFKFLHDRENERPQVGNDVFDLEMSMYAPAYRALSNNVQVGSWGMLFSWIFLMSFETLYTACVSVFCESHPDIAAFELEAGPRIRWEAEIRYGTPLYGKLVEERLASGPSRRVVKLAKKARALLLRCGAWSVRPGHGWRADVAGRGPFALAVAIAVSRLISVLLATPHDPETDGNTTSMRSMFGE